MGDVPSRRTGFYLVAGVLSVYAIWIFFAKPRGRRREVTTFDAFLIENSSPIHSATHFNSFLKDSSTPRSPPPCQSNQKEAIPDDAILIPILYGTEYGFSKEISETLASKIQDLPDFWPVMINMADHPNGVDLEKEQILLFVCSTQGDGVPPFEARKFCTWLFDGQSIGDLSSTLFTVCALGDRSYTHFCRCGQRVRTSLLRKNAKELVETVKIDKENWTAINSWIASIIQKLPSLDLTLERTHLRYTMRSDRREQKGKKWTKSHPFMAKVLRRWNLCRSLDEDDKKTMHLELNLGGSDISFLPGDAVTIYPENRPEDVDELLGVINADGACSIPRPSWPSNMETTPERVTLRDALLQFYDLRNPKTRLFHLLAEKSKSLSLVEIHNSTAHDSTDSLNQIREMLSNSKDMSFPHHRLEILAQNESERERYLSTRHISDILQDFGAPSLSIDELLSVLRPLQSRQYSISSSYNDSPSFLSIAVAEVKYKAQGKDRVGVASTFLSERVKLGDHIAVYITPNPDFRLPPSLSTPIIMIGPGTGVAPFRSFILEKLSLAQNASIGINLLFFGCRKYDQDFLYRELIETWHSKRHIELSTAFSREQEYKIYVQQRLWECREQVWKLVHHESAHLYVCGDAQFMAPDVDACLLRIIQEVGGKSSQEAIRTLETLSQAQRYQRDIWF